jgi:serine/threonine protein kinase
MPILSASAQATGSIPSLYQNTQYEDKPSKNIHALTVVKKITPEANGENHQCNLFFYKTTTSRQVSIVNGDATIENVKETPPSCAQLSRKPLGSGAFGQVSKGLLQNEHGQIEVAVKNLIFEFNATKCLYSEANALHTLKNEEHIVTLLFALYDPLGLHNYLVMECGDMNLDNYLRFTRTHSDIEINIKQLAKIGYDIFSALLACLKYDVWNIDIKLDNFIMFLDKGIIKLADFGILASNRRDGSVQLKMIRKTANCFVKSVFSRNTTNNVETQKQLAFISSRSNAAASISNEDKAYFSKEMLPFVDNNPLLLKLTQGVFSNKENPLDINKTTTNIKNELELQTPTDIRHML